MYLLTPRKEVTEPSDIFIYVQTQVDKVYILYPIYSVQTNEFKIPCHIEY
jgi:hypothetical protein